LKLKAALRKSYHGILTGSINRSYLVRVAEVDSSEDGGFHLTGTERLPGSGRRKEERRAGIGRFE
jgi:hypothetical protein